MMNDELNVVNENMFTKIPNYALYTYGSYDKSILEQLDYDCKVVQVLDYLYYKIGMIDKLSTISIEHMVLFCGYKPNNNKGQSNYIFKNILCSLKELGYISSNYDIVKAKPKDLI